MLGEGPQMSFEDLVIPRDVIRDWSMVFPGGAVNINVDTLLEGAVGLDIFISNLGAAPLTINWDGQGAITVPVGAAIARSGAIFRILQVVTGVVCDLVVSGIKIESLRRMGIKWP